MHRNHSVDSLPTDWRAAAPASGMDALERQFIFREMVVQELRKGRLSSHRRRRVVQFAAHLGIHATQAGRLIQEARRLHEQRSSPRDEHLERLPTTEPTPALRPTTILAIVAGAVLVNSWLIVRLFG